MTLYRYKAIRKCDGVEIHSGTIDDALTAGRLRMKMTIIAGLLSSHPGARGLQYDDILIRMRSADEQRDLAGND